MKGKLLIFVIIPLLFFGCDDIFDSGDFEKTFDGLELGFFPQQQEVTLDQGQASVEVQLIGPQQESDTDINFSISEESTAVEGTHYDLATNSPVTLEAGTSTVDIVVDLIAGSLEEEEEVTLTFVLEDSEGIVASPNLLNSNMIIRPAVEEENEEE